MSRATGYCSHCNKYGTKVARNLCSACYTYEWRYGKPRPYRLARGPVSDEEFDSEWEFMLKMLGRDGGIRRLRNAYGFSYETMKVRLREYNERHMHDADVRDANNLLDR